MRIFKKIIQGFNEPARHYMHALAKPIIEKTVLFEGGQGKNCNGNMFALIRAMRSDATYNDYRIYWVIQEDEKAAFELRLATYKIGDVQLVERNSKAYTNLLGRCQYLFNDNSFPPYFNKRNEQIYTNTWHGTPIKKLGISDLGNAQSLANIQKNYTMCDYACFPNDFTKKVFLKDYALNAIYTGRIINCDYPRNDALYIEQSEIVKEINIVGKRVYAYMPTWRGSQRTANVELQSREVAKYLKQMDKLLHDDEVLLVNFHFLLKNEIDFAQFTHIKMFPPQYETYDVLAICDCLISDYSSVVFDYAVLGKPMVLFTYDLAAYEEQRGTYMNLASLKIPMVNSVEALIETVRMNPKKLSPDFKKMYVQNSDQKSADKILDCVIKGNRKLFRINEYKEKPNKNIFIYVGDLRNEEMNERALKYVDQIQKDYKGHQIVVAVRGKLHPLKIAFLEQLKENVVIYGIVSRYNFTIKERIYARLALRYKLFERLDDRLSLRYQSEFERLFPHIPMELMINYGEDLKYISKILAFAHCAVQVHFHPEVVLGLVTLKKTYPLMLRYFLRYYPVHFDHRIENAKVVNDEEKKGVYFNKFFRIGNILYYIQNNGNGIHIRAICLYLSLLPFVVKDITMEVGGYTYKLNMKKGIKLRRGMYLGMYNFTIPYEDIKTFPIHSKIELVYQDQDGYGLRTGIKYNLFDKRRGKYRNGPVKVFSQLRTSAFLRQSKNNVLYLCVRKSNRSDHFGAAFKIRLAYLYAKIFSRMRKITLCFEKESERYEESASVLFEKCIDEKIKDIYFVLDKNYPYINEIKPDYRKRIVQKGSFRHYLYFFSAHSFFGSEALVHAIDLRIANKLAHRKLNSKKINYVFLQHGVMYMISLNSNSRTFFKPLKIDGLYRVVVSSEEEAKHFIELGEYAPSSLYISGLPKYDRNLHNENADRITIMLTWRSWEYNEARINIVDTDQYRLLQRMVAAIPSKYQDKITILVHPLISDALINEEHPLKQYFNTEDKFDTILENTDLFISDYSSITYDAFYRGCNVIFCWEEKDICLDNYGENSELMINNENVFGDIAYKCSELKILVANNYQKPQLLKYKDNYHQLVQFDDNRNTQRLFDMLKKDQLI